MERQEFDFVIVGSGASCVPAALVMKRHGKSVLIVEKQDVIGGTSAYSGGVIWIPDNHLLNAAGGEDTPARAREYFDAVVGDAGPASSPERRDAFIRHGAGMVRFLEEKGMKFVAAIWPDYYSDAPGGHKRGRSLAAPLFDVKRLGAWAPKLAKHPLTSAMPVSSAETVHLFLFRGHWKGRWVMAKAMVELAKNKLLGRWTRGAGNALQGRLFEIALREDVPIWTDTAVTDLIEEDGRVAGVIAERDGAAIEIRARSGVLLNAGGFSRNERLRAQHLPQPSSAAWTQVNPADHGDMLEAALRLGAATDLMDAAVWEALSFLPDGTMLSFHSPNDIGKPHCIAVDGAGRRFVDETVNYMAFGQATFAAGAVPSWAIFDAQHRAKYTWGPIPPGALAARKYVALGYLKRADTIAELARLIGMDPAVLGATVDRFNGFAKAGVDEDYHRGETEYGRFYGDSKVKPNPTIGTIAKPPFYAVEMQPGDLGTMGGLLTDEHARVLRDDGSVIPGLYATGNTSASVMGRHYLGAGATVGPSMVFGYVAARHAAGAN